MLVDTSTDSNKVKYEFSIYSYDRLESAYANFFGTRKDSDIWGGPSGYGFSSTELEVKIATIDSSDDHIATFTFEFDNEFLPSLTETNYVFQDITVYPITKALAEVNSNVGSTPTGYFPRQYVSLGNSSFADTVAPEVVSIDLEPYQNSIIYPQRDYLKATATITNNSSNDSSLTSIKDLFMSMISPDCSYHTMYLRDELDGKIDPNTETISATFPILKNHLGTYHLTNFNINDWGFAERVYLYETSLLGNTENFPDLIETHPDIGKTITIGDGTTPTCPLFDNYKNDSRWSEYITIDENTSVIGTFSATGLPNDTITYSLDPESYDDFYQGLSINSATGELSSNTPFDADSPDGQGGDVTVIAQSSLDTSIKNRLNLTVTIRDLDDEPPYFSSVTDADLCDITGIQTSRTCSIADGTSLINSGYLANPDGADEDSNLSIGGVDADLVEATRSTSDFFYWNVALKSNADISQKDQYEFTFIFSTGTSDKTRTENITLNVTN